MKTYVAGLLFTPDEAQVLLIQKHKPDWQRGRFNAIGGKIEEGETPGNAMFREFMEETGCEAQWDLFAVLTDARGWEVYFFSGFTIVGHLDQKEAERPAWFDVNNLPANTIPNLRWLIPLARRAHLHEWPLRIQERWQPQPRSDQ
jgi:8-oxo-dGTP diphosphatase